MFKKEDIVYSYTRAQAIEDGTLVDITASGSGLFKVPLAITNTAYGKLTKSGEGDCTTTMFKMLLVLLSEIRKGRGTSEQLNFVFEGVDLKSLSHPGDKGEHVITIMLPHED